MDNGWVMKDKSDSEWNEGSKDSSPDKSGSEWQKKWVKKKE